MHSIYFFFRDINKIADGIGAKYGRIISSVVSFVIGYVIGFIYVWQLTLVMLSLFPLMVIVGALMTKVNMKIYTRSITAFYDAQGINLPPQTNY